MNRRRKSQAVHLCEALTPSAGMVAALFGALIALQALGFLVLGTGRAGKSVSLLILVVHNLLAIACAWIAFRRARNVAALFWFLYTICLLSLLIPTAFGTYDTVFERSTLSASTWRVLFCLYGAPILMMLFLPGTDRERIKSEILLDLFQVTIVVSLIFSTFFLLPVQQMLPLDALRRYVGLSNLESLVLLAAVLIRLVFARVPATRNLLLRVGLFLLVCAIATYLGNRVDLLGHEAASAWFDLGWAVPYVAGGLVALTWRSPSTTPRVSAPTGFLSFLGTNLVLVGLLLSINLLVGRWQQAHGRILTAIAVAASLIAFAVRLALTQYHQQQEIAERKRTQEQMRLQATALESAANAILVTDTRGTIQWVNPAFTQLTGYTVEEAVGKNTSILKSGKHDESFYKELWNTIGAGRIWKGEITNRKKDGQLYIEELTIAPVWSATGKITNFVAIKEDFTERKRVQAELVKAKESAELASRAKSQFLANMSHELRTPMNGIMGMTELALDTELTSEQREYLGMVKTSADSLLTVINDILDFSKIEAGKLEFESIEFNLRGSLEAAVKVLALRAHERGLELNCHVQPGVPEILVGDPTRLRQVITNLIGNAIKFTERGEVTLSVERESEPAGAAVLHFSVTDTGIGIPADRQAAIFDAFTQADSSTTRRHGGSGLGLTISRRLVEMFGGRLWLESTTGQGSTFHFTARFGFASSSRPQVLRPAPSLEGVPVLVVDDNYTNRRVLGEFLIGWRMKPTLAGEARTALQHLKQAADTGSPFPLVLLDSRMPEVDGFALVEQIKQDPRLAASSIIMLTSAGQRGDAARCRELGVTAYLTKPIGQAELLDAILKIVGAHVHKTDQPPPPLVTRHSLREGRKILRILLAEDNLVNQTVAARLLEKQGHAFEVANNGREALARLSAGSFDLVLMDVQMPEMDGFEATAAIRETEKTKGGHIPIIAMTAHSLKGDQERCLAAGMDGYISKPIQVEHLLTEIERVSLARTQSQ